MVKETEPRLMGIRPTAKHIGLSEWGVRNLIRKGLIPVVRIRGSRRILFDIRAIDRWIEENSQREIK
jgi:hypothetical protein